MGRYGAKPVGLQAEKQARTTIAVIAGAATNGEVPGGEAEEEVIDLLSNPSDGPPPRGSPPPGSPGSDSTIPGGGPRGEQIGGDSEQVLIIPDSEDEEDSAESGGGDWQDGSCPAVDGAGGVGCGKGQDDSCASVGDPCGSEAASTGGGKPSGAGGFSAGEATGVGLDAVGSAVGGEDFLVPEDLPSEGSEVGPAEKAASLREEAAVADTSPQAEQSEVASQVSTIVPTGQPLRAVQPDAVCEVGGLTCGLSYGVLGSLPWGGPNREIVH